MYKFWIALLSLATLCGSFQASADALIQLGWIEKVRASSSGVHIERSGQQHNLRMLSPLFEGDRIVVSDKQSQVSVVLSGKPVTITYANSPFIVRVKEDTGLLGHLSNKVASMLWSQAPSREIGAISRGHSLTINGLNAISPKIQARSALYLSWQNGHPPYQLVLINPKSDALLLEQTTTTSSITLDIPDIQADELLLQLSDSQQQKEYYLTIVSNENMPGMPELGSKDTQSSTQSILHAIWLYEHGDGDWQFEAIQQIYALAADGNALATELLHKITVTPK